MTNETRQAIDKMNEDQLRKTSSIHSHDKELVSYIDTKLDALNVDAAIVEPGEYDVGEFFQ